MTTLLYLRACLVVPWRSRRLVRQQGFSLIELIMVMVLIGILAIFAAPRMFSSNAFYARGFHDETLAFLRYAQKSAVAQRRTVCVTFATDSATLNIASVAVSITCDTDLQGPKGNLPGTVTAKAGNAYSTTPIDFNFNGLGQPVNASGALADTQVIQIRDAANSITVEAVTGYVHE